MPMLASSANWHSMRLVGRLPERAALDQFLAALRSGESRALVLLGEPGIGKSRLLRDACQQAADRAFSLATGAADPLAHATPLFTLRAAMQRIVEAGNGVVVVLRQTESARELAEAVRSFAAAAAPAVENSAASAEGAVLRTFGVGAQILKDLGVKRMRVLSAPKQMHGIAAFGLEIEGYVGEEG